MYENSECLHFTSILEQINYSFCVVIFIRYESICISEFPMWSSVQSSLIQIQRSRVRFPALQDFLYSRSETGSTQTCEDNLGVIWLTSRCCGLENQD
jgi:hypothetical protein